MVRSHQIAHMEAAPTLRRSRTTWNLERHSTRFRAPFQCLSQKCCMLPAMARQSSFDIVSKVNLAEVKNAVNQALKEVRQRFDLKNSQSDIQLHADENKIVLTSREEATCAAVDQVLRQRLARRGVSLKALTYGVVEPASKDSVRQSISLQQGIPREKAREIVKLIKKRKIKVQAAIREDYVRVSGKVLDDLQEVIAMLKEEDLGIDMQFTNYCS